MMRNLFVAALAALSLSAFGAVKLNPAPSTGAVVPGVWNANFAAVQTYAEEHRAGMLVFMGSEVCDHCDTLIRDAFNSADFKAWQAKQGLAMAFCESPYAYSSVYFQTSAVFRWFKAVKPVSGIPMVGLASPSSDGSFAVETFMARAGQMPVKTGSLVQQLIASLDEILEKHRPQTGFGVGETEGDRLEAGPGTTFVDVPLVRSGSLAAGVAGRLDVIGADGSTNRQAFVWLAGESNRYERVATEGRFATGGQLTLRLYAENDLLAATNLIAFADRENSPKNPTWRGCSAFGEWTMDLAAATNMVVAYKRTHPGEKAYTLALLGGSLWCPDCAKTDAHLVGRPEFKAWATSRNVACVAIDIPNWPNAETCLLTRQAAVSSSGYAEVDPDEGPTQSGAGYLSRWMISDADAAARLAFNKSLVGVNTLNGGWNRPERANQSRTGVPVFVLLNDDGSIAGRIETFASTSPTNFCAAYTNRLDELLGLAGGREDNVDCSTATTPDCQFRLTNATAAVEAAVSAVDLSDCWKVAGLSGWKAVTFSVRARPGVAGTKKAFLKFYEKAGEKAEVLKTVSGDLVAGLVLPEMRLKATGEYFVQVLADKDSEAFRIDHEGSSVVGYRLTATVRDDPGKVTMTAGACTVRESDAADRRRVGIRLTRDGGASGAVEATLEVLEGTTALPEHYTFPNGPTARWADGETGERSVVVQIEDDRNADGDRQLRLGYGGATYVISIVDDDRAVPGRLSIAETQPQAVRRGQVIAAEGSDIRIGVARLDGTSGPATARLTTTAGEFAEGGDLAWATREGAVQWRTLRLPMMSECRGGRVTVSLAAATGASIDGAGRMLNIQLVAEGAPSFETEERTFSLTRYVALREPLTVGTRGLTPGGRPRVTMLSGPVPAGLRVQLAEGKLVVSGTPMARAGTSAATYQIVDVVGGRSIPGTTVRLTFDVTDVAELDPSDPAANPSIAKAKTYGDMVVVDEEAQRLTGLLTGLTVTPTGRLSARYRCTAGTFALSAASWCDHAADGTMTAELTAPRSAYALQVAVGREKVTVRLTDPDVPGRVLVAETCEPWSAANPATPWQGLYTVAFHGVQVVGAPEVSVAGDAVATLRMDSASAARMGRMTYVGYLPNGQVFSGSTTLVGRNKDGVARLPIFFATATDFFTAMPKIAREAPSQAVTGDDSVRPYWRHTERQSSVGSHEAVYQQTAGSYYDPRKDLVTHHADYEFIVMDAATELLTMPVDIQPNRLMLLTAGGNPARVSLSLSKSTGVVNGSFRIVTAAGSQTTATFRGVLLQDWDGCVSCGGELPWMSGSFLYTDRLPYEVGGSSRLLNVRQSGAVLIQYK